jgi:Ca-activated chloride channel homolog
VIVRTLFFSTAVLLAAASAQPPSTTPPAGTAPPRPPTPPRPFSFPVDVPVVTLTVVVQDQAGHFVHGLGPSDVEVLEDGALQHVSYFRDAGTGIPAEERPPLSVVLVLDGSGSMRRNMPFLQEAAVSFLRKLKETDRALVVQFNEGIRGSAEFTSDLERLEQFVLALQSFGGTSLYDAVQYGLGRIKDQPGRKAVIVFSDGADHNSTLSEDDVVEYARTVEATVYCVGIRGSEGFLARGPRGFLRKVARETGGEFFYPDKVGDLIRIFSGISDELQNHYLLAYTPSRAADGAWRRVEVRLKHKQNAEVRARKGYFAVARRSTTREP